MFVIDVGPLNDNPQTHYKLVFGHNVSYEAVLSSLKKTAQLREDLGFTTKENTLDTVREAEIKLRSLNI